MDSIRIMNLRSLQDTGEISLEPLTILLGRNSSGKSTFARSFPLIKQSVDNSTSGSMLWFGELVDFGDFKNAVNRGAGRNGSITFQFSFEIYVNMRRRWLDDATPGYMYVGSGRIKIPLVVSLDYIDAKVGQNDLSLIAIKAYDHFIEIYMDKGSEVKSVRINGVELRADDMRIKRSFRNSFLPFFLYFRVRKTSDSEEVTQLTKDFRDKGLLDVVARYLRSDATDKYKRKIANNLRLDSKDKMLVELCDKEKFGAPISRKAQEWSVDSLEFLEIANAHIFANLDEIIGYADEYISSYFRNVKYIAPLRATADRYYRLQNLSVDDIDYDGKNLPMILKSLTKRDLESYNNWLFENFNFTIQVQNIEGHISLKIREGVDGSLNNLSDIGFGYSQILPIITQLWLLQKGRERSIAFKRIGFERITTLVIEQPELHLHPAMQAMFADAIVAIINQSKSSGREIRMVIETHSDTIINRLSQLIKKNYIDNTSIVVYIFDKGKDDCTVIKRSAFDSGGFITNWPLGFFLPEPIIRKREHIRSLTDSVEFSDADLG